MPNSEGIGGGLMMPKTAYGALSARHVERTVDLWVNLPVTHLAGSGSLAARSEDISLSITRNYTVSILIPT